MGRSGEHGAIASSSVRSPSRSASLRSKRFRAARSPWRCGARTALSRRSPFSNNDSSRRARQASCRLAWARRAASRRVSLAPRTATMRSWWRDSVLLSSLQLAEATLPWQRVGAHPRPAAAATEGQVAGWPRAMLAQATPVGSAGGGATNHQAAPHGPAPSSARTPSVSSDESQALAAALPQLLPGAGNCSHRSTPLSGPSQVAAAGATGATTLPSPGRQRPR